MKSLSFHGAMTRTEAELTLEKNGSNDCYLTRYDDTIKSCFLTVKTKGNGYKHFAIDISKKQSSIQYELIGTSKVYATISDLLNFYEKNPINFQVFSIGEAVLCESDKKTFLFKDC